MTEEEFWKGQPAMARPANVATSRGADDTTQPKRGETDLVQSDKKRKGRAERYNQLAREGKRDETVVTDNTDRSQSSTPTVPTDTSGTGPKAQAHGGGKRSNPPAGAKVYRRRGATFEATQWWAHGDHPAVERLDSLHDKHGNEVMRGRLSPGDLIVRTGDWIMMENGKPVVVSDAAFQEMYEEG